MSLLGNGADKVCADLGPLLSSHTQVRAVIRATFTVTSAPCSGTRSSLVTDFILTPPQSKGTAQAHMKHGLSSGGKNTFNSLIGRNRNKQTDTSEAGEMA